MKPKDWVAMIIAGGLISWGLVAIIGLAWRNKNFTEGGGEALLAIITGLSVAISSYFTRSNGNGDK